MTNLHGVPFRIINDEKIVLVGDMSKDIKDAIKRDSMSSMILRRPAVASLRKPSYTHESYCEWVASCELRKTC